MTRILVIDNEAPIRANIERLLRLEGFEVIGAEGGARGLELARERKPDLVLCDIVMPEVDGFAVLAALKADPGTRDIPFVFITASAAPHERAICFERGATGYLSKPFTLAEVMAMVRDCLPQRGAGG